MIFLSPQEDCEAENVWEMGGLGILTSLPITPRVVCFLCASSGHVEVRYSASWYTRRYNGRCFCFVFCDFKKMPWLGCLTWLGDILQSKMSPVPGHVPGLWVQSLVRMHMEDSQKMFLSNIDVSLPLFLPSFPSLYKTKNKNKFFLKFVNTGLGNHERTELCSQTKLRMKTAGRIKCFKN